jgi:hypothetical protein
VSLVCLKLDGDFEVGSSARAQKLRILGCNALLLSLLEPVVGVVTCEETLVLRMDTGVYIRLYGTSPGEKTHPSQTVLS